MTMSTPTTPTRPDPSAVRFVKDDGMFFTSENDFLLQYDWNRRCWWLFAIAGDDVVDMQVGYDSVGADVRHDIAVLRFSRSGGVFEGPASAATAGRIGGAR